MGWARGAQLADELWDTIKKLVPKKQHKKLATKWIEIFENEDCDTLADESCLYRVAEIPTQEEEDAY